MPVLTTLLHATNFRNPFLRTLIPSLGLAYGIQAAVAIPSILAKSERFYDLSGSLTYLSCTALSLLLPTLRARHAASLVGAAKPAWPSVLAAFRGQGAGVLALNWRQVALSAAVSIWAARLGSYLFMRITKEKEDSRFKEIRQKPLSFFGAFMIQATWVSLCMMPILALNSLPSSTFAALGSSVGVTDVIGLLLYVGGLSFEVAADRQKSRWSAEKAEKKHDEDFLTRGLWSKSRHPNYFGESTLWTGIATVSAGVLMSSPGLMGMGLGTGIAGKAIALLTAGISPAFVTFLLLKVSGVPLSEKKYDKKYGDREDYKKWKRETPMFFPKL
jgi:steroid 5-alpha reductase family enzyme